MSMILLLFPRTYTTFTFCFSSKYGTHFLDQNNIFHHWTIFRTVLESD